MKLDKMNVPPYCDKCQTYFLCAAQEACFAEHSDIERPVKPHRPSQTVVEPFPLPLPVDNEEPKP